MNFSKQRRQFLKRTFATSMGVTSASLGLNMSLVNSAMANSSTQFNDYKALVCVFLYGGNDSFNMLVPTDNAEYQTYADGRQNLAYAQDILLPITSGLTQPYSVGMPNSMTHIHDLYTAGKLGIVANTGTLVQPVTKAQLIADRNLRPAQLFSHNNQQDQWQSAGTSLQNPSGWGGRMAEMIMDTPNGLPISLSIDGSNLWQTGLSSSPFSLNASGPESFAALDVTDRPWNQGRADLLASMLSDSDHILERAFRQTFDSAASNNQLLASALSSAADTTTVYPNGNSLGEQLQMVAKLISVQQTLGQSRQVFYVGLGGWDTHDNQNTRHPALLAQLGEALKAFDANLTELGLTDNVTTFTSSDFGRTLTSNGDGTDHGWGGHQLIMGGAVNGGNIIGAMPDIALGSDDDLDDGRIIPSVSVEQYGAELAKWFGLTDSEANAVFPNLSRFEQASLGMFTST